MKKKNEKQKTRKPKEKRKQSTEGDLVAAASAPVATATAMTKAGLEETRGCAPSGAGLLRLHGVVVLPEVAGVAHVDQD